MSNHAHDHPKAPKGATRIGDLIAGEPLAYGKDAPRREVTIAGVTNVLPTKLADQLERTYASWAKANPQEAAKPARRRPQRTTPNLDVLEERAIEARARGRLARMERFDSEIDAGFRDARMQDIEPLTRGKLAAWIDNPQRRNLLLVGPVGVGKTHAAHAIARVLAERGMTSWPRVVSLPLLMRRLRPDGPVEFYDEIAEVPILVLDDLGSEKMSEWTAEQLALIIDQRWAKQLPILATTNLTVGDEGTLLPALGERAYSRLARTAQKIIQFQGEDRRKEVAEDD
jgi:DNA replication protein DnaC